VSYKKKAEAELNEVPGRVEEDLKHIKEWISKQPHLKVRTDDQWLLSFLRGCKFSLERTKEKLDNFYTMKTLIPEFFSNRDPLLPEIQDILNLGSYWIPLPKSADPTSPRVLYMGSALFDPERVHVISAMKVNQMILDILLFEDDSFNIAGHHVFQDLKGMSVGHMMQMTPAFIKKTTACFHERYPARARGMHFINIPSFFETMYSMVRPFLTEKMKSRVFVHGKGDYSGLQAILPKSALPKECGGENGTLDDIIVEWKKKVESYRDWFLEDANHCSDESKRPGKPKTSGDVFGIEGSFRKLEVD